MWAWQRAIAFPGGLVASWNLAPSLQGHYDHRGGDGWPLCLLQLAILTSMSASLLILGP